MSRAWKPLLVSAASGSAASDAPLTLSPLPTDAYKRLQASPQASRQFSPDMPLCRLLLLAPVALLLAVQALAQPAYTLMGGWIPATVNQHSERALVLALRDREASTGAGLCYSQVDAVQQQLVNGINFRFYVRGCPVGGGKCGDAACSDASPFQIDVFVQPWTNTARVLNVAQVTQ